MIDLKSRFIRLRDSDEDGFGLIEVLVAIAVFAIVTTGLLAGMIQATKSTTANKQRTAAANLASQEMDRVRSTTVTDLPIGLTDTYYDLSLQELPAASDINDTDVYFQVSRLSEWVEASGAPASCTSTTTVNGQAVSFLSVQVEVTWRNQQGVAPVRSDTVITPTVGAFDRNSGNIPVRLFDSEGQPRTREVVDLYRDNGSTETFARRVTTDDNGCAFFSFVPVGDYIVVVDKDDHVDKESQTPTRVEVSVSAGTTVGTISLEIERSATLSVRLPSTSFFPLPCAYPVVISNPSLLDDPARVGERIVDTPRCPTGSQLLGPATGATEYEDLYPYVDGADVWLGRCRDSDPSYWTGVDPTPERQNAALAPGEVSPTLNLLGRQARITVTDGGGNLRPDQRLVLVHLEETGDGARCEWHYVELGNTNASGVSQVTLPYGQYRLWANGYGAVYDNTADTTGEYFFEVTPETSVLEVNFRS